MLVRMVFLPCSLGCVQEHQVWSGLQVLVQEKSPQDSGILPGTCLNPPLQMLDVLTLWHMALLQRVEDKQDKL